MEPRASVFVRGVSSHPRSRRRLAKEGGIGSANDTTEQTNAQGPPDPADRCSSSTAPRGSVWNPLLAVTAPARRSPEAPAGR
ncbi:hypothetical protein MATL_G00229510 [Megalops atlanticus]|uniref:Uncharacterized protein n=1 Tax=Megalops atlanticus TaxID=7932 RepID=A0A9D3PET4_MEGAT|nr:hypothetical protein MATL_G00229510 [Megalops atlanticus]